MNIEQKSRIYVVDSSSSDNLENIPSEDLRNLSMFNSGFSYKGVDYSVEFHSLIGKKVPDEDWCQVYVVGDLDGKVPVVIYDKKGKESRNLPGGGVEAGESFEDALRREVLEELNMEVLSFEPLGHQINHGSDGKIYHQLRVYAKLKKLGEFKKDIGGSVIGYELVDIKNLNKVISWGEVGDWFSLVLRDRY